MATETDKGPYIWASVIIVLIAAVFFLTLLYLRPQIDAVELLGNVAATVLPTIASVLAYLKAQETHLSVNSRLTDFINEHGASKMNEGIIQGTADEQVRVAKQKLVDAAVSSIPPEAVAVLTKAVVPDAAVERDHNSRVGDNVGV